MSQITDHTLPPEGRGGHCIPVDPYYLVHRAEELGYHPQVILAGRAINDSMPAHVAGMMIRGLNEAGKVINDFFTKNRVKTALRVELQFLAGMRLRGSGCVLLRGLMRRWMV